MRVYIYIYICSRYRGTRARRFKFRRRNDRCNYIDASFSRPFDIVIRQTIISFAPVVIGLSFSSHQFVFLGNWPLRIFLFSLSTLKRTKLFVITLLSSSKQLYNYCYVEILRLNDKKVLNVSLMRRVYE